MRNKPALTLEDPVVNTITDRLVDLDLNFKIKSLLVENSNLNHQLAHFSNGCKAIEALNYIEALKEFFLVVEKEMEDESNKHMNMSEFKALRHGLSHLEINDTPTIKVLEKIGINCKEYELSTRDPKGKYVDIADPLNVEVFDRESRNFRAKLIPYVENELNNFN